MSMVSRYQKPVPSFHSGQAPGRSWIGVRSLPSGIGIHIELPRVEYEKLSDDWLGEPSAAIRARVEAARDSRWSQRARFEGNPDADECRYTCTARRRKCGPAEVRDHCRIDDAGKSLLKAAMRQLQTSARGNHRTLKLALSIADPSAILRAGLAGSEGIETVHPSHPLGFTVLTTGRTSLAEAIHHRPASAAALGTFPELPRCSPMPPTSRE